jgi:hypothetical protein
MAWRCWINLGWPFTSMLISTSILSKVLVLKVCMSAVLLLLRLFKQNDSAKDCCSTTKLVSRRTESWCLPSIPYYKEHKSECAVHCFHGSKCSLLCWLIAMDAHLFHYNRIWFFLAQLTWMSNYFVYHIYFPLKGMKPHSLPHTCHKPRPTAIGKNHILFLCFYLLKWDEATTLQACCRWNEDSIGFFWVLANIRTESCSYWILEMEQKLRMRFLWIYLYT